MRNAQDFNLLASDKRWVNLMGVMEGASRDLKKLAPRPDKKNESGPLFVRVDRCSSNDDAMMATMLISAFTGAQLHGAASYAADGFNAIDAYDMWQHERHSRQTADSSAEPRGNRGIELGEGGFMTGGFNMLTAHKPVATEDDALAWEAYMRDLPCRRVMEQSLASLNREVDRRERQILRQHRQMAYGL